MALEKRAGESTTDYTARQRRVKLSRNGSLDNAQPNVRYNAKDKVKEDND